MISRAAGRSVTVTVLLFAGLAAMGVGNGIGRASDGTLMDAALGDTTMNSGARITVQYLEIVTPEVGETCKALGAMHGVTFGDPIPELGDARTAALADGGRLAVRAPMRDSEAPVVRPYLLTNDIEGAIKAAEHAGAQIAIPPMEIPGQGTFAIYILGGIDHGLWQKR